MLTWVIAIFTTLGTVFIAYPLVRGTLPTIGSLGYVIFGIVTLGLSAALFWFRHSASTPNLSILEITKTITIHDIKGERGTIVRGQNAKVNRDIATRSFVMKGIRSEGTIEDIRIDGVPVGAHECERRLGALHICKTWSELRRKGDIIDTQLSYDVVNTYLKETESTTQDIPIEMDRITVEVNFPIGRNCKKARAYLSYNDEPNQILPDPHTERTKITFTRSRPKLGEQYVVTWEW